MGLLICRMVSGGKCESVCLEELGPYKVGSYTVSDQSFGVGQYGDIEIAQLHLVSVAERSAGAGPALSSAARV